MAKVELLKIRPIVIGVGGAAGKTSLANFISIILKSKYSVLESQGKNSETGIPLSILRLSAGNYTILDWIQIAFQAPIRVILNWKHFDFFVAEMGIDGPKEPKNMEYLLKIVRPKIAVLTNIALEHSEYFDSTKSKNVLDAIAREELLLLKRLPKDGLAVLNLDDPFISKVSIGTKKITISSKRESSFRILNVKNSLKGFSLSFENNGTISKINLPSPLPKYYAYTIMMAVAACSKFISTSEAIKTLQRNFFLPPGRFNLFNGIKNSVILDSSYNSSPVAVGEALELLSEISEGIRRVAILGDMRELGFESREEHKKLGKIILENTDLAILIGPMNLNYTVPVLTKAGHKFYAFKNLSNAKKAILKLIEPRDLILVKGSQNTIYLERIVEMLLKDKKDKAKLPRRGKFWDEIRRVTN